MPKLNEYLGGLVASVTNARVMSDLQTVKVAEEYAKHNLLKHFSVPRMRIEDIEMTIPVALDSLNTKSTTVYEPIDNTKFNSLVYKELLNYAGLSSLSADLSSKLRAEIAARTTTLEENIRINNNIEALADYSKNMSAYTYKMLLSDKRYASLRDKLSTTDMYSRLQERLTPEVKIADSSTIFDNLEVIVEASKLREEKPENIIQIKLRITEDGMEWNRSENSDGSIETKLLPE